MEYSNEYLAALVLKIDPKALWAYNYHCGFCAKFLYPEEIASRCKKCKTSASKAILRPIPFLSSAAAIEKLIVWLRDPRYKDILNQVERIISSWINSDRSADTYRLEIVIACVNGLNKFCI